MQQKTFCTPVGLRVRQGVEREGVKRMAPARLMLGRLRGGGIARAAAATPPAAPSALGAGSWRYRAWTDAFRRRQWLLDRFRSGPRLGDDQWFSREFQLFLQLYQRNDSRALLFVP